MLGKIFNTSDLRFLKIRCYKKTHFICTLVMHNNSNCPNVPIRLRLFQWLAQPSQWQKCPFHDHLLVSYCCPLFNCPVFLPAVTGALLIKTHRSWEFSWIISSSKHKPSWVKSPAFTLTNAFPVGGSGPPSHCLQSFAHLQHAAPSLPVLPTLPQPHGGENCKMLH